MSSEANPNRVAGGLKATINNPRIPDSTKQNAEEKLSNMQDELGSNKSIQSQGKETSNVIGGYKATLSNPKTSNEAKEHAHDVIEEYKGDGNLGDPDYIPEDDEV